MKESSSVLLTLPLASFTSPPAPHQAQRKADNLHQSLSALGDKVHQQMAPNKDVQKEIADVMEVNEGLPAAGLLLEGC